MNVAALVLVSWLAQAGATTAPADTKAQAQALLKNGTQKYQQGAYEEALESFSRAYAVFHSPKLLFNIGQAHRELGHALEAIYAFEKFVELATDASPELIAEAKLAAKEVAAVIGTLKVDCAVPDIDIEVDGKLVGRTPFTYEVRTTIGPHRVTAIAPDHRRDEQMVEIRAGQATAIVMQQASLQAPTVPLAPGPRKWTWLAAGSTVVFASVAIVTGLSMQSSFESLRSSCGRDATSTSTPSCQSADFDALDTLRNVANVFWGLTAAAAVTTGVLFYIEGRPVRVAPMVGVATGLQIGGRY